jgi:putative hemolysin
MHLGQAGSGIAPGRNLQVSLAHSSSEIEEAQRLRYRVFADEMGARIGDSRGLDADRFDDYCEHLIVRDTARCEVVGTYRLLSPDAATAVGGYYAEQEFDIARFSHLLPGLVEIGRACVHGDYRSGAVISLLWCGIIQYMQARGYSHVAGCASIGLSDGGHVAAAAWKSIVLNHLGPAEYRVFPRIRLRMENLDAGSDTEIPPLLKGYFGFGAFVCGDPAWDPDFNSADLLVLMPMAGIPERHLRRFGKRGALVA